STSVHSTSSLLRSLAPIPYSQVFRSPSGKSYPNTNTPPTPSLYGQVSLRPFGPSLAFAHPNTNSTYPPPPLSRLMSGFQIGQYRSEEHTSALQSPENLVIPLQLA